MTRPNRTPNRVAKDLIDDQLETLLEYWSEATDYEDGDKEKIQAQLEKRVAGVRKYLGIE